MFFSRQSPELEFYLDESTVSIPDKLKNNLKNKIKKVCQKHKKLAKNKKQSN